MAYYPPQGQYPPQYPYQQPYYPPQPQYSGCLKFFLYALSFCIPLAGVILGIVYLSKGDPESKGLGTACLVIAIVTTILSCCVGGFFAVSSGLLSAWLESAGSY